MNFCLALQKEVQVLLPGVDVLAQYYLVGGPGSVTLL